MDITPPPPGKRKLILCVSKAQIYENSCTSNHIHVKLMSSKTFPWFTWQKNEIENLNTWNSEDDYQTYTFLN